MPKSRYFCNVSQQVLCGVVVMDNFMRTWIGTWWYYCYFKVGKNRWKTCLIPLFPTLNFTHPFLSPCFVSLDLVVSIHPWSHPIIPSPVHLFHCLLTFCYLTCYCKIPANRSSVALGTSLPTGRWHYWWWNGPGKNNSDYCFSNWTQAQQDISKEKKVRGDQ